MVLEGLGENLRHTLKKIANASNIDEKLVKEVIRDIQRALLQADVNVKLAIQLTREIEKRALTEKPPAGTSSREHVVKIVYEELVKILGKPKEMKLRGQTIMMVGLYGQGKTTTCGKLAKYYQKKGLKVGLIAADVHRPAAYEQLKTLAGQTHALFYGEPTAWKGQEADEANSQIAGRVAAKIVERGIKELKPKVDVIIVDTAGRDKLEEGLIDEMKHVFEIAKPDEKFLVMDAQVGQQAGPQAQAFHDAVQVTGVIITKLDGTAKGGGALSAVSVTKAPVVFIGVGEKVDDLEKFEPARFISRLLGMGDIQTLLEKAQELVEDEDEAEETAKKIMSGRFSLVEMRQQMDMLNNMGPLSKVLDMIPGMGSVRSRMQDKEMEATQLRLKKFRVIMDSMTQYEMENPENIKSSRIKRISRGAGVDPKEVKELLKYYETSKKTMKGLTANKKAQRALMKRLKMDGASLPPGMGGDGA
ncbi:MAG TPA: signal recognition particle protein Srp54 [Candidatus Thermoplasmatota archaeon]|nr:signal recognition particle protein Srp54 [Candidatus Thermoplasmatota archaeon]